jgi:hypothetical protein
MAIIQKIINRHGDYSKIINRHGDYSKIINRHEKELIHQKLKYN